MLGSRFSLLGITKKLPERKAKRRGEKERQIIGYYELYKFHISLNFSLFCILALHGLRGWRGSGGNEPRLQPKLYLA